MADHLCPVWLGYVLANRLRRLFQNPERMLSDWISPGDTLLDVGCAMGFFSIPMARMVGPQGRVICVDLQPEMLTVLRRRAHKAGVGSVIQTRSCTVDSLKVEDLHAQVDFSLAFYVVHEVQDQQTLMCELYAAQRPGGKLLMVEPKGHVTATEFADSLQAAAVAGFRTQRGPSLAMGHTAILVK